MIEKKISDLSRRADNLWGEKESDDPLSPVLGSAKRDRGGAVSWNKLARTCFVAPNFYFEFDQPERLDSFEVYCVGSDRDDRPLYYSLETGAYAVSADTGLLLVGRSSLQMFEIFIVYAEWIRRIIAVYGGRSIIESTYDRIEVDELSDSIATIMGTEDFDGSFWDQEMTRRRNS